MSSFWLVWQGTAKPFSARRQDLLLRRFVSTELLPQGAKSFLDQPLFQQIRPHHFQTFKRLNQQMQSFVEVDRQVSLVLSC